MAQIKVKKNVYSRNQELADENRRRFADAGLLVLNLISSPGSGKTSLLERTVTSMADPTRILVVEGDVETERDAERLRRLGIQALQIQTHGGCHLNAEMVARCLENVKLNDFELLLIENVGNLICPVSFDLGEDIRVVVGSTTEGDDKPAKYPEVYHTANVCVLNKIDLLPHVTFDADAFRAAARRANDKLTLFETSCTTGQGIDAWIAYLKEQLKLRHARA